MIDEHPLLLNKKLIAEFWDKFGGTKNTGYNYSSMYKLNALIEMSKIKIQFKVGRSTPEKRNIFNSIKHKRHQFRSHELCFVCQTRGEVRHHIILLNNGGINSKKNIVTLCKICHAEIHPWLKQYL